MLPGLLTMPYYVDSGVLIQAPILACGAQVPKLFVYVCVYIYIYIHKTK